MKRAVLSFHLLPVAAVGYLFVLAGAALAVSVEAYVIGPMPIHAEAPGHSHLPASACERLANGPKLFAVHCELPQGSTLFDAFARGRSILSIEGMLHDGLAAPFGAHTRARTNDLPSWQPIASGAADVSGWTVLNKSRRMAAVVLVANERSYFAATELNTASNRLANLIDDVQWSAPQVRTQLLEQLRP